MSSRLDSAVKRCSSEIFSLQRSSLVKGLARRYFIDDPENEVVGVAKWRIIRIIW